MLLFDQVCQASTRDGKGAVLLISGPVGSGKTALLQEMAACAGRRDGRAFVVTGSARERLHPYGLLARLIQSMCVAGMADPLPGGLGADEDFFEMMHRVSAAFRDFSARCPVVVGVDDVHLVDEPSLRALSYLIRRIETTAAVVVVNESTSYERDMVDLRAELLHLPFCHRVRLAPLTCDDIAEQLHQRLGAGSSGAYVRFCAQVTGGIPLLLQGLIDDLVTAPGPVGAEPGPNFRQAVLRGLHRCTSSTAEVAQAMAVLGDFAAPELVAELGSVDVALVGESIRDLQEMGLLERKSFRHPRIRAAVLAGIPEPSLPEMHGRAAVLLHQSGAPAHAVAEQLIAAQDGGKASWRVSILCEAAREALAWGDVDSAVLSLRHAVSASADESQRAYAGVHLAEALWHTDPSRAARGLDELGQDARAGLITGPETLIAVNQLLWWGEFAQADELLWLVDDEDYGDSTLAHLWTLFCQVGGGAGLCDESRPPVDSQLAQSGAVAAAAYLSSAASLIFDGAPTDRPDRMLLGLRAGAPLTPALYALVLLVQTGRLDEVVSWCDRLLKEEWIHRSPMRRVMIRTVESVALLRSGDSSGALRGIREVFGTVPPAAWGVVVGLPMSVAVRASTDLGDTHAARSYLAVPVPPAMFDTPFAVPYLLALGWCHLAMGHPQSALKYARSCLGLTAKWGVDATGIAAGPLGLEISRPLPPAAEPVDSDEETSGWNRREPSLAAIDDSARLTDAEQRVAALAAAGSTNRQIAERLFITVSTVEQHLTKVYRKLNVRSRSGLR
ncbi:helix-turn-helix transcriptional regulator [Actinoplanes regularis]|uniref:helix-turn-helix transcriptional regulator n=1 Tax=Actinoplanes regularis TaxID=52697 RepID=UPI0024A429BA|nr:LuxR family transcriptional regulator [Actinoplanes regularis]GLW35348.1 hypothetical protein Areg01_82840 [Actinoplanes regularis]